MINLMNVKQFALDEPPGWTLLGNAKEFANLPETHREQICFLDGLAAQFMYDYLNASHIITGEAYDPFSKHHFKTVDRLSYISHTSEGISDLKKWLYRRGVPFKSEVFVLPVYDAYPFITTWKIVLKYSGDIFRHDDVVVFDQTFNWCLYYHHDNQLLFGKDNVYDTREDEKNMEEAIRRRLQFPGYKPPYY